MIFRLVYVQLKNFMQASIDFSVGRFMSFLEKGRLKRFKRL